MISFSSALTETLIFEDDFNDASFNTTKWGSYGTAPSESGGYLNIPNVGGGGGRTFAYSADFNNTNLSIEFSAILTSPTEQYYSGFWNDSFDIGDPLGRSPTGLTMFGGGIWATNGYYCLQNASGCINNTNYGVNNVTGTATWKLLHFENSTGYTEVYRNGVLIVKHGGRLNKSTLGRVIFGGNPSVIEQINWVKVYSVSDGGVTNILTNTLTYPSNNALLTTSGSNFTANYTTSGYNFTNATYYVWEEDSTLFNRTVVQVKGNNTNSTIQFIDDFTLGNYAWNVYLCGVNLTGTLCKFANNNFTFNVGASVDTAIYNLSALETSSQYFVSNITILNTSTLYDVKMIYDGVSHDSTFTTSNNINYNLYNTIDLTTITSGTAQNKSFYYRFIYDLGSGAFLYQNSSIFNQTVNPINLTECTTGNITLNFTAYNEENMTRLNPYNFLGTFDYWIGAGTTYKTLSLSKLNINEVNLCTSNITHTYKTNSIIQYEKDNFIKRNYYLVNATINNVTQNISLFFLDSTVATSYIIDVKGSNQLPVTDAYLYIQRYYPGTNQYETVGMVKTDDDGRSVFSFEDETEDYRIIVFKNGQILHISPVQKIYCTATPCTVNIQVSGDDNIIWSSIGNLTNLLWNLDFNYTTNMFSFTYVDTSGTTSYGRLYVYQENSGRSRTTICNTNSTANAATLNCNVTGYNGTITAQTYISRSPEALIYAKTIIINSIKAVFGMEGLFWAMIIIMVLAIAGLAIAGVAGGILGTIAGVIMLPLIGIASFGAVFFWGIIILGIFILWLINQ
jgi:hypothetical protein